MLEYKTQWYGSRLITAPRFYPSTKRCSVCGQVKVEMPLSERVFGCEACGAEIDRDRNAALNLASLVAGSSPETQNACGGEGSGQGSALVKPAPVKQEPSRRKLAAVAAGNKRP
jgi:putative transposase